MKSLHLYETHAIDQLVRPEEARSISVTSSACEVITDFTKTQPLMLLSSASAVEAEQLMRKTHVRLKLVIDDNACFLGVVGLEDLNSQEVIKKLAAGFTREDLTVADFMRPRSALRAFDINELERSTIADVVQALKSSGYQHCLVVDRKRHSIRGVISASDIARKLNLPLDLSCASNFAAIFAALHPALEH